MSIWSLFTHVVALYTRRSASSSATPQAQPKRPVEKGRCARLCTHTDDDYEPPKEPMTSSPQTPVSTLRRTYSKSPSGENKRLSRPTRRVEELSRSGPHLHTGTLRPLRAGRACWDSSGPKAGLSNT